MLPTTTNNIPKNPSSFTLLPKPFLVDQNVQLHNPARAKKSLTSSNTCRKNAGVNHKTCRRAQNGVVKVAASMAATDTEKALNAKAIVTVKPPLNGVGDVSLTRGLDDFTDVFGYTLLLEFVSAEVDTKTGLEKPTIKGYAHYMHTKDGNEMLKYEGDIVIPPSFGEVGAVIVENEHRKEMYLAEIVLDGLSYGAVRFTCNSWVHSKFDNPARRVFFTNKFNGRLKELEGIIDERNATKEFKNRHGAGIVPYELLKPYSEPGVTSKGIPNSISI